MPDQLPADPSETMIVDAVPATGASVTVHSGRGRDTRRDRHWNRRGYVWDNTRELSAYTPRAAANQRLNGHPPGVDDQSR
jgi:hypothetical protein